VIFFYLAKVAHKKREIIGHYQMCKSCIAFYNFVYNLYYAFVE